MGSGQCAVGSGQWSAGSGQYAVGSEQWTEKERIAHDKKLAEQMGWKYYLPEAEQSPEVRAQLSAIPSALTTDAYSLTTLKVIDPCCGSGHILAYLFDVLMQIYEHYGYTPRDAVTSILQNNLYGLDIDDRAAQLAYFAVMMKARRYDRRFFSHTTQPHVYAIEESNRIEKPDVEYFCNGKPELKDAMHTILTQLYDAKEYGSILTITPQDWDALYARFDEVADESSFHRENILKQLLPLVQVAQTLAQKYDVVVTNPPYMGSSGMGAKLAEFVKKNYPDSKSDLFAVFIEVCSRMAKQNGYQAMITQHAWMFLSSFEKLREKMMLTETVSMAHLGARAFEEIGGEVVQTTSFVRVRTHIDNYKGVYCRLIEPTTQQGKEEMFLAGEDIYIANQDNFAKIPGCPVAYWIPNSAVNAFGTGHFVGTTKKGILTGNTNRFLRMWSEVNISKVNFAATSYEDMLNSASKWYPLTSGGQFRRWYGNLFYVIDMENDASNIKLSGGNIRLRDPAFYCREAITWTQISFTKFSCRYVPRGVLYGDGGPVCFFNDNLLFYLAILNSTVGQYFLNILSPCTNYGPDQVKIMPVLLRKTKEIEHISDECQSLSHTDWDSFETSWDFTRHPFVRGQWLVASDRNTDHCALTTEHLISESYSRWKSECEERFEKLKANEEELNRIFIDIYGLQDELTPEVEDKDVTVRKADLGRDVRSFISYAVGCMFGRYSPTYDGLAYAGGEFSDQWVVVGGQYYKRELVEWYVSKELQRTLGMAEVDADRRGNVSAGETAAEGRIVRFVRPDAKSGSVDPLQYRRGTSEKLYEGICKLSLDCQRVGSGVGDTVYDLCSPEILAAITNGTGNELVKRGWKDAERIDWQAVHCTLTTDHFCPDRDGIIPICDDEYFEDDMVGRFVEFVRVVYGDSSLEDNLRFIANALGGKGQPKEVIRNYFLNDFYTDHCKIYQKRPIYWLFDSGKKNGFKCLIYLHRYQPDTIARIRTDYVHEQQARYRTAIEGLEKQVAAATSTSERVKLTKQLNKVQAQDTELHQYEEKVHALADQMIKIDLDDGVKHNYEIFKDVLAKIK